MTVDRGASWREFALPTAGEIRTASFVTPDVGYAVDLSATLFRTANGGVSWQILDVGDFVPVAVHALTAQRVVLLGRAGALRRSTDGGQTFASTGTPAVRAVATRGPRAGAAIALFGARGIATSTNGVIWRIIRPPVVGGRARSIRDAQCTSAVVCWIVTFDRRLYRTVDAGRSWADRTVGVGPGIISALALENRNRGYLVVANGLANPAGVAHVLRTKDSGLTWTPQGVGVSISRVAIAPASGIDFALDGFGNLFTTTTGGLRGTPSALTLTTSVKAITRRTRIILRGRLAPAQGGELVVVSGAGQPQQAVTVASNGRFSASFTISKTTASVAQWAGDRTRAGDGSAAVTVRGR